MQYGPCHLLTIHPSKAHLVAYTSTDLRAQSNAWIADGHWKRLTRVQAWANVFRASQNRIRYPALITGKAHHNSSVASFTTSTPSIFDSSFSNCLRRIFTTPVIGSLKRELTVVISVSIWCLGSHTYSILFANVPALASTSKCLRLFGFCRMFSILDTHWCSVLNFQPGPQLISSFITMCPSAGTWAFGLLFVSTTNGLLRHVHPLESSDDQVLRGGESSHSKTNSLLAIVPIQ